MLTLLLLAVAVLMYYADRQRFRFALSAKPYPTISPKPQKPHKPKPSLRLLMARVKFAGTGAISISGKIAGTVFNQSGVMGAWMRVWAKPKNRRTAAQSLVRGVLTGISAAFRSLSSAQITAWNHVGQSDDNFAIRKDVFGDTRHLSGSEVYQRVNNVLESLGLFFFSDPPVSGTASAVAVITPAAADAANTFTVGLTDALTGPLAALPANTYAKVYATDQTSKGRNFFGKSKYRLIGTFAPTAPVPLDIQADYVATFGAPVAGQNIAVAVEIVSTDATNIAPGTFFSMGGRITAVTTVAA